MGNISSPDIRKRRNQVAVVLLCAIVLWMAATPVLAAAAPGKQISWWTMGIQLFGGLAIFLFGMEQLAEALQEGRR